MMGVPGPYWSPEAFMTPPAPEGATTQASSRRNKDAHRVHAVAGLAGSRTMWMPSLFHAAYSPDHALWIVNSPAPRSGITQSWRRSVGSAGWSSMVAAAVPAVSWLV